MLRQSAYYLSCTAFRASSQPFRQSGNDNKQAAQDRKGKQQILIMLLFSKLNFYLSVAPIEEEDWDYIDYQQLVSRKRYLLEN